MLGHTPDPWSSSSVGARLTCAVLAKGDALHLCLRGDSDLECREKESRGERSAGEGKLKRITHGAHLLNNVWS